MSRIKSFESTGISPNGRLFAGDLNAIQDHYSDISNFGQTHDVGTLRVGDATLQLLKFGTGEFRMSGALRVDSILRGLGGLYAGAFTTTQRNAIAAGSRPYGLVILNTTTNQYEWNQGTDATPNWVPLGSVTSAGTIGSRPTASVANAGQLYFATDDNGGTLYRSNGSAWVRVALGLSFISRGTLSVRPAANASPPGNLFVATDDHGGTTYETDGASWQKIAGSVFGELPIGAVVDWPWAAVSVPAQAVLPYGQAISRTLFPELHALAAAAGYPHGAGDGSTTFNLPDYRGRAGLGLDDMGGSAANRITLAVSGIAGTTLGASGGSEGITLTQAQIPAHTHSMFQVYSLTNTGNAANNNFGPAPAAFPFSATNSTGGGGAHPNVQPAIMVNKIMRAL